MKNIILIICINLFLLLNIYNYQQAEIKIKDIREHSTVLQKAVEPIQISIGLEHKIQDNSFVVDLANRFNIVLNVINRDSSADFYIDNVKDFKRDKIIIGGATYSTKYEKNSYLISSSKDEINDYERIAILKTLSIFSINSIDNNKFLEILADNKINLNTVKYKSNVFEIVNESKFFERGEKTISIFPIFCFFLFTGVLFFMNLIVVLSKNSIQENFAELIEENILFPYIVFNCLLIFLSLLASYIV